MTHKPDRHWRRRALCHGRVALFLTEAGPDAQYAQSVCLACPVREACLEAAMAEETGDSRSRAGIRGGLTPVQRVTLARLRRAARRAGETYTFVRVSEAQDPAPCGTLRGVDRHRRNGEAPCDLCIYVRDAPPELRGKRRSLVA